MIGLMKRDTKDFNMFSFDNRLRLQKFSYLLQHVGKINLEYNFDWYHYGPYCKQLTQECFNADCEEIHQIKFEDIELEKRFEIFLGWIEGKNNFWMEVVASIHYLKELGCAEEEIIKIIKQKHLEFQEKDKEIRIIFEELKSKGKI